MDVQSFIQQAQQAGYKPEQIQQYLTSKGVSQDQYGGQGGGQPTEQANPAKAQYQQAWQKARDLKTRDLISESYKKAYGEELFATSQEKLSADEKKNLLAGKSTLNFIDQLEKSYQSAGGGSFGIGPGSRLKGKEASLLGMLGLNEDASVYNDSKSGFAATLKSLTGDTGVLTDQDFARLSKLLPSLGSTKKEATDKFNQLRDQMSAKFGIDKSTTGFSPTSENTMGPMTNFLSALLPSTAKAVQSYSENPPNPIESATMASNPLLGILTNQQYRENIPQAGGELLTALGVGKGVQNIAKGAVPLFASKGAAGKGIEEAASAATKGSTGVKGNIIIQEIEKVYESATAAEKKQIGNFLTLAKKQYKNKTIPYDIANRMLTMANDAYNASGQVGNSAKAAVEAATSRAIRGQLPKSISAARKVYGVAAGRDKFIQRSVVPAATGIGLGAGIYGLLNALGIGRGQR